MSTITVLHISDLHFVKNLETEGSRLGWRTRTWLAKSHSYRRLVRFMNTIVEIRSRQRTDFDLLLATGDVTTDGSIESMETALKFIEREEIWVGSPARLLSRGLGAKRSRRLIVPGNHDRYKGQRLPLQRKSSWLETVLKCEQRYPYTVGFRPQSTISKANSLTLIFFVYDSTPPSWWKALPWNRIARGCVSETECDYMVDLAKKIVKDRQVDGLNGNPLAINPDNCIRIAVLHHHPVADPKMADEQEKFKYMENNEYFVENCFKAGIQLVLFGHQHWRYQVKLDHTPYLNREIQKLPSSPRAPALKSPFGKWQNLYFVCAPSTLEYSAKNGFFIYRFGQSLSSMVPKDSSNGPESGQIPASYVDIDCFEWDEGKVAFSRQPGGKIEFI